MAAMSDLLSARILPSEQSSTAPDERQIRSAVQSSLNACPDIDPMVITVSSTAGVVSLRGQVHNYAERICAQELAVGVAGVEKVENFLTVHPYGAQWDTSDATIREQIDIQLGRKLGGETLKSVRAEVSYHCVTLTGSVPSALERKLVRHIVEEIDGVDLVDSKLLIQM
jgi:osmotically-inducible protein OsmY